MVGDVVVVVVALYGAFLLHGRTDLWQRFGTEGLFVPVAIVLKVGVFYAFALYRGIWRDAGTPEMLRIAAATAPPPSWQASTSSTTARSASAPRCW